MRAIFIKDKKMVKKIKKYMDLDNFEVCIVGAGIVALGAKVIEYYYSLLGGL